jgi:hypothetical protein
MTFLVDMYACESLTLTLMEGYKLRIFECEVQRRIFGPKINSILSGLRELCAEIRIINSKRV